MLGIFYLIFKQLRSNFLHFVCVQIDRMKKNGEEIELELIPAKSLHKRLANVPNSQPLLKSRYIKVPPDITGKKLRRGGGGFWN